MPHISKMKSVFLNSRKQRNYFFRFYQYFQYFQLILLDHATYIFVKIGQKPGVLIWMR